MSLPHDSEKGLRPVWSETLNGGSQSPRELSGKTACGQGSLLGREVLLHTVTYSWAGGPVYIPWAGPESGMLWGSTERRVFPLEGIQDLSLWCPSVLV